MFTSKEVEKALEVVQAMIEDVWVSEGGDFTILWRTIPSDAEAVVKDDKMSMMDFLMSLMSSGIPGITMEESREIVNALEAAFPGTSWIVQALVVRGDAAELQVLPVIGTPSTGAHN